MRYDVISCICVRVQAARERLSALCPRFEGVPEKVLLRQGIRKPYPRA